MKEDLIKAKDQLIERWKHAFDEIDLLENYRAKVSSIKYATSSRYDLEDFSSGKIKAGGKLTIEKPSYENHYEYGFDKNGSPVYSKHWHVWNKIEWAGFYRKESNLIEYVEFCVTSRIPSRLQRIILLDGKKILFESLAINGGASGSKGTYWNRSKEECIELIMKSSIDLICTIEKYEYKNGSIDKSYGLYLMPGIGQYSYEDAYKYYDTGKLKEVRTSFNGIFPDRLKYFQSLDKTSLSVLSERLSRKLAELIIIILAEQEFISPLSLLVISYQCVGNYWPSLVAITGELKDELIRDERYSFLEAFLAECHNMLPIRRNDYLQYFNKSNIDADFQEFIQMITKKDNWNAGTKMLRKVSNILTTSKLEKKINVTDDFVAFPIDWELEGSELEKIIAQCGAEKKKIKEWKQLGWL